MGIKSFVKQLNPYKRRTSDITIGNNLPTTGGIAGNLPNSVDPLQGMALHEILRGGVAQEPTVTSSTPAPAQPKRFDSELGEPPAPPVLRTKQETAPEPELYGRTRKLGPAPVFDNQDTNGAFKSSMRKGGDAFLSSGNPFAFLFGALSGATNDKTYDERKSYRRKAASYDAQYERAFTQDKAEADAYLKQRGLRNDDRNYQLNRDKFLTEQGNKAADNTRSDEQLAHSIVTAAMKRQGGTLLPQEKATLERIYKRPIGDTVPPEIANRLLQLETPQGNVYGVADINSTSPARLLTGPNGSPAKVKKSAPLVQVSVGEAGKSAVVDFESNNPEPSEEDFDDESRIETAQEWMNKGYFKASDAKAAANALKGTKMFEEQVAAAKKKKFAGARKNWNQKRSRAESEGRKQVGSGSSAKIPASDAAKKYNFK